MNINPKAFENAIELKGAEDGDEGEALVLKSLDALTKTVEDRLAAAEKKSAERLDKVEAKLNRPAAPFLSAASDAEVETKSFLSYVRRGVERMGADETKALTVGDASAGGYLAPEQFVAEIDKKLVEFSPIRQVARIVSVSSGELILPKRTGTLSASWVGETTTRPTTQPAYGQAKFDTFEIACNVPISNRLLEDAAFDMAGELSADFAEEFGRTEASAFINGDGLGKPNGILTNTEITRDELTSAVINVDDLIRLFHSLPSFYASKAVWAMNRQTIGRIRALTTTTGEMLWQDALSAGNPATILGRPVIEFPDMPNVVAGATPIVFGDFSHFRVFDRIGLTVTRDPYTMANVGQVVFHARRRIGGGVTKAEAFRFLSVKA